MIDFTRIRGDTVEGRRNAFEQLVCQLARLDAYGGEFRRIAGAGGDGGVEALRILPNGHKIGYQAKYYPNREDIDWNSLDESVRTALTQHSELERYVVALPCDFTGKRATRAGSTEGTWGKWDARVARWEELATARGREVKFEPWTAFEVEMALRQPNAHHLIRYFFDRLTFTREWMQRHLDRTIHDLKSRYSPSEHVETESLKAFDVVYRRENIRRDLKKIFAIAQNSDLRAAVALIQPSALTEADLRSAENSQDNFLVLGEAIDWGTDKPWPVCGWLSSWYSFTRKLRFADHAIWDRISKAQLPDGDALKLRLSESTKLYELTGPEVFGGTWARLIPLDVSRAALFVGRAGAGKSHVLARGGETAWASGAPVVHILGQHILDEDPRVSILKRLEIADWSFYEALAALNLAAEAANTRALLLIDALNEGNGTDIWRNHLASFISEVNKHDRIVLVLSCREEYLDYVVPSDLIANPQVYPDADGQAPDDCAPLGKLVSVQVAGFRTTEEQEAALQKFMDDKGIARPAAPALDPEFFNPLFLSSVCRSMANAGIKVFPGGLHGAREVFQFVLKTKTKALGTRHDGTDRVYQALLAALNGLAALMVERREDSVPLDPALDLIASTFRSLPISDHTWLEVLEASDILRRDVQSSSDDLNVFSRLDEVIRFSFQRLQDNLIAEHLILECRGINIEDAFDPEAPLAFLVRRLVEQNGEAVLRFSPRWIGVLGSLWSAVAETYSKELYDIRSFFGDSSVRYYPQEFQPVFRASIRERRGTAFSPRTKGILDHLWEDEQEKKLAIILSTACVPDHAWNAEFLMERILSVPDRDAAWAHPFSDDRSELVEQAVEVTNWSSNIDARAADTEVVRLAGITLTWLSIVANPTLRERAKNGLANLVAGAPELRATLKEIFHEVDDRNLQETLFASGA